MGDGFYILTVKFSLFYGNRLTQNDTKLHILERQNVYG